MLDINFQIPDDKIGEIGEAFEVSTVIEFKTKIIEYVLDKVKAYKQRKKAAEDQINIDAQIAASRAAIEAIEEDDTLIS
jgi:hypothetical protein